MDKFTILIFSVVVLLFASITLNYFTGVELFGRIDGYLGILAGALAMISAYKNFTL